MLVQHKLLFRVVRGGGDFLSSILVLSIYLSIFYLSSGKRIFFESAGILFLSLVNKN